MTLPPTLPTALSSEVAAELAVYIRNTLHQKAVQQVESLENKTISENQRHKDLLQDVQSQLSNVIEPIIIHQLVPIAKELEETYKQIDLLHTLIHQVVGKNIQDMTNKLEKTEQMVRRQERALNKNSNTSSSGGHRQSIEVWRGVDMGDPNERRVFVAKDHFDEGGSGKLR